jgi:hypothetical protein
MPVTGELAVVHDVTRTVEAELEGALDLRLLKEPVGVTPGLSAFLRTQAALSIALM